MSERVSDPFDTLVIGGGIAGLTAALFATRSGCSTLVLVPGIPGGQPSPAERATETSSEDAHAQGETPRMSWARLLKRVFDIDLEHCPTERLHKKPFAVLRPSGPVQQWIFHQAEKELTTLPLVRYSSGP